MFLITEAGRSGTKYMAQALRLCGLDVYHERMGADGIVSSFYCFDADWYPGHNHPVPRPDFDVILHQTRHPLKAIGSIQTGKSRNWSHQFLPVGPGTPELTRCCHYWLVFNEHAEQQADLTYRIEDLEEAWPEIQRLLGFSADYSRIAGLSKRLHTRPHSDVTWADVREAAPFIYCDIREAAERYGY